MESLAAWHLPLLSDPAFLPLQPQLQRALLRQLPERLLGLMRSGRRRCPPQVLVARQDNTLLGVIISRPLNRTASCWQVQHLRIAPSGQRRQLSQDLLREAIQRARGATSWIATSSSLDNDRLAALREQGFQPLRTERLWRLQGPWQAAAAASAQAGSEGGQEPTLRPLNRRTAWALFQLEQAACPAQLRQLLDRSSDDLLDQSHGRGWMLLDAARNQAVAGLRWLGDHPGGGHDLELTVHPGWTHLIGAGTERLLGQARQALADGEPLWLRSDVGERELDRWLQRRGAEPLGERVLMARSVWRRQECPAPAQQAARRLEAMLEQLQPRRRPLPTPVGHR
ncbi:MAG: GNAT family N-acetyltransferase [Cyanobium sp. M30B3]|nr:MAG: GNAT family N-acetyltransferase [Cyanobium sp. M30B3]